MATTQTETNYSEQPQAIGTEKGFVEIPQCIATKAKPESPLHQQKNEHSEHLYSPGLDSTTSNASDATSRHPTNAHLPQCFSADFIPDSFSPEELSVEEEQRTLAGETQPPSDSSTGGSEAELSQRDARRLKCLRSFQQILREKRESRRQLSIVTFSEDDLNPGILSLEALNFTIRCSPSLSCVRSSCLFFCKLAVLVNFCEHFEICQKRKANHSDVLFRVYAHQTCLTNNI